jgi:hypothetical protein
MNPSTFPGGHPLVTMRGIGLGVLAVVLFVLYQIDRHKSWARRAVIVQFFFALPSSSFNLSFAWARLHPTHLVVAVIQLAFMMINYVYDFILAAYLLKKDVRSLFISTPPKLYRQILLSSLLLGFGYLSRTVTQKSITNQGVIVLQLDATTPQKLKVAQTIARTKVPDWGEIGKAERFWSALNAADASDASIRLQILKFFYPRRGFAVVPYLAPGEKLTILLFVADEGAADRLDEMLVGVEKAVRMRRIRDPNWTTQAIPGVAHWVLLAPTLSGQKRFFIHTKEVSVQMLSFPQLPGYKGEEVRLQKNGLGFTVLAYQPGPFDETRFKEFLEKLQ